MIVGDIVSIDQTDDACYLVQVEHVSGEGIYGKYRLTHGSNGRKINHDFEGGGIMDNGLFPWCLIDCVIITAEKELLSGKA